MSSKLIIEAGKFYRARDGKKCFAVGKSDNNFHFVMEHCDPNVLFADRFFYSHKDGSHGYGRDGEESGPLDLVAEWVEEADVLTFEPGKVYVDRKGFDYLCLEVGSKSAVFEAFHRSCGTIALVARLPSGHYLADKSTHDYDIIAPVKPAPKRIKGWMAVWAGGLTTTLYDTREQALGCLGPGTDVAVVYIDVPEGEGLEK